jgi:hypothetical protein
MKAVSLERSSIVKFTSNVAAANSQIASKKKWTELSQDAASREKQYFDWEILKKARHSCYSNYWRTHLWQKNAHL